MLLGDISQSMEQLVWKAREKLRSKVNVHRVSASRFFFFF